MISIQVPATSANMGPGFDSIGVALQLYNHLWVEEIPEGVEIEVRRKQPIEIPTDETNLIYQTPELLQREWYINCDMSKYIAYLIDTLNHDSSISDLLDPSEKIQNIVARYKEGDF